MKVIVPQINTTQMNHQITQPVSASDLFGFVQQYLLSSGLKSSLQDIEQQKKALLNSVLIR